jgi:hypothetical protein
MHRLGHIESFVDSLLESEEHEVPAHVYHVTFANRLDDIAQDGLQPGAPRSIGGPSLDHHAQGRVFVTAARGVSFWFDRADLWAHDKSDDFLSDRMIPVVLRISTASFADQLEPDTEGTRDAGHAPAWFMSGGIPADQIELWDGSRWIPVTDAENVDFSIAIDPDEDAYGEFVHPAPFEPQTLSEAIMTATLLDDTMDPIIHTDLDEQELDVSTWAGEDFVDDGFLLFLQDYIDANTAEYELDDLSSSRLGEARKKAKRPPGLDVLKKHKVKLTDEERTQAMDAGAVWKPCNHDGPVCAIWKSVVNGRSWYGCNTHRLYAARPTLKGAIRAFHDNVEPSS